MSGKTKIFVVTASMLIGAVLALMNSINVRSENSETASIVDKIEQNIQEGRKIFLVSSVISFTEIDLEDVCLFVDRESSSPASGEDALTKRLSGKNFSLEYKNASDYTATIALVAKKDVKLFHFRKSWIDVDGRRYFFAVPNENAQCFNPSKAVFNVESNDKFPNEGWLRLGTP